MRGKSDSSPFNGMVNVVGQLGDTIAKAVSEALPKEEEASQRPDIARSLPVPLIDAGEERDLELLDERYKKFQSPGMLEKVGHAVAGVVPEQVKDVAAEVVDGVQAQQLYKQAFDTIARGYSAIEEQAARFAIDEASIVRDINQGIDDCKISCLEDIAFLRAYDIARVVGRQKGSHLVFAFAEGAATGVPGFAGLPFNLVLSTFLYYRAVQCVAMYYGYDVKNDPSELVIAGEVFANSLAPSEVRAGGVGAAVGKVMIFAEAATVKQTVKKGWAAMAAHGGAPLVITQMRALSNAAARKALEKAGRRGLENSVFKNVFKQIGGKLTQKTVGRAVPIVGGAVGALFDTGQMNGILDYADMFYHKRFILEKGYRINRLIGGAADWRDVCLQEDGNNGACTSSHIEGSYISEITG